MKSRLEHTPCEHNARLRAGRYSGPAVPTGAQTHSRTKPKRSFFSPLQTPVQKKSENKEKDEVKALSNR